MEKLILVGFIFCFAGFLSACSFGYEIVIVNDSDKPIEVRYKINEKDVFNNLYVKNLEDWQTQKSIKRLWIEDKPWQPVAENDFITDLKIRERIVKIAAHQIMQIESGGYNPISEDYGDLTNIIELKITSETGEIAYRGRLLLKQFEKDGYTFVKTYKDELKEKDLK